jgi:hypothetical protein
MACTRRNKKKLLSNSPKVAVDAKAQFNQIKLNEIIIIREKKVQLPHFEPKGTKIK